MVDPTALILSLTGVGVVALAYRNRSKPEWQRDMRALLILGVGQVILGIVVTLLNIAGR